MTALGPHGKQNINAGLPVWDALIEEGMPPFFQKPVTSAFKATVLQINLSSKLSRQNSMSN